MTEVLVHPYRASNELLVNQYYGLLSLFPNLQWVPPDLAIADAAARVRARYHLRTPDALQVATAIRGGASAILTNDSDIARVPELEVGIFDRLR
jgi:predicted nucleic acid-binding protein